MFTMKPNTAQYPNSRPYGAAAAPVRRATQDPYPDLSVRVCLKAVIEAYAQAYPRPRT